MTEPRLRGLSRFRGISREQCGVIVRKKNGELVAIRVVNNSHDPEKYVITEESITRVEGMLGPGEQLAGFIHTHLAHHDAEPSGDDWDGAARNPGLLHAVYKPSTGELTWYIHEED